LKRFAIFIRVLLFFLIFVGEINLEQSTSLINIRKDEYAIRKIANIFKIAQSLTCSLHFLAKTEDQEKVKNELSFKQF
jgi:hypothetical protein